MAGSILQYNYASNGSPNTSASIAFNSNNVQNNVLWVVVFGLCASPLTFSISDTNSNTYVLLDSVSTFAGTYYISHWYVQACAAGANTVNLSMTGGTSSNTGIFISEITGVQNTTINGHNVGNNLQVNGTNGLSSGSVTTTTTTFAAGLGFQWFATGDAPIANTASTQVTQFWPNSGNRATLEYNASVPAASNAMYFTINNYSNDVCTILGVWFAEKMVPIMWYS